MTKKPPTPNIYCKIVEPFLAFPAQSTKNIFHWCECRICCVLLTERVGQINVQILYFNLKETGFNLHHTEKFSSYLTESRQKYWKAENVNRYSVSVPYNT
jgi:hypothetical protein